MRTKQLVLGLGMTLLPVAACVSLDRLPVRDDAGPQTPQIAWSDQCPCTRRPEGEPSRSCPWGSGLSISANVDGQGATVRLSGTAATTGVDARVEIPAGALRHATGVTLTELTIPPPAGYFDYSPVYALEPLDLALAAPGEIALPHTNLGSMNPADRIIFRADAPEGPFTAVANSNSNAGFSQATLLFGGYYFVGIVVPEQLSHCL